MKSVPTSLFIHSSEFDTEAPAPHVGWEYRFKLDVDALRELMTPTLELTARPPIQINLSSEHRFDLRTDLLESFAGGGVAWRGSAPGAPDVRAYIAAVDLNEEAAFPVVSGELHFGSHSYEVSSTHGDVFARKIPVSQSMCGDPLLPSHQEEVPFDAIATTELPETDINVIKIIALYPPELPGAITGGLHDLGVKQLSTYVAKHQLFTNEVFSHSNIPARVEVTAQEEPALNYAWDNTHMLSEVVGVQGSALWERISKVRDDAQASIVALLTSKTRPDTGGKASRIPEPPQFFRSDLSYATFVTTPHYSRVFAHELGHLLGAKHDRFTQPHRNGKSAMYDYARGYVPDDRSFGTIMSYDDAVETGITVPAFSAADCTWQGKAIGIPMGRPDAADAAHLLRQSVRVVANYRGSGAPRWNPVALSLSVNPDIGGTITPSALGPYPEGTTVRVTAEPRTGHKFVRWILDGKDAGTVPTMTIKMDVPRDLRAEFAVLDGASCKLSLSPLPEGAGGKITITPPGPTYPPGTDITVEFSSASADLFDHWEIDGRLWGTGKKQYLRMERDHTIKAVVRESRDQDLDLICLSEKTLKKGASTILSFKVEKLHTTIGVPNQTVRFDVIHGDAHIDFEHAEVKSSDEGLTKISVWVGQNVGQVRIDGTIKQTHGSSVFDFYFDVV